MNLFCVYILGVLTLPALFVLSEVAQDAYLWIRDNAGFVHWNEDREFHRWEWSTHGRSLSFTFKRWPHTGFAVTLRPWRPAR